MEKEIKTLKHIHGYTEWKDINKYVHSLKNGFKYYYDGKYDNMKKLKKINFEKQGRHLSGDFGWFKKPYKFEGRVQKILWPACNSTEPIVFFNKNTLQYG